jgi:hypothetical protein
MKQKISHLYISLLRYGIALILLTVPFYTVLSIWTASRFRHLDLFKSGKEITLTVLIVIIIGFLLSHRKYALKLFSARLILLMLSYSVLVLLIGVYDIASHRVSTSAVIYGWLIDLRLIGIFLVSLLTFSISKSRAIKPLPWRKILLAPAVVVIIFGFLQATVLPHDVLRHFGYGPTTTQPYETVDNQPGIIRIQSSLRGPNPFGAYLLIIIVFLVGQLLVNRRRRRDYLFFGLIALGLFDLYSSYSRSAEIGLVLSLVLLVYIHKKEFLDTHRWQILSAGLATVILVGFAAARHNYLAQNIIFHTSSRSTSSVSSNAERATAMKTAAEDVIHHPLGSGVGSAGPASRRNNLGQVKIAENYYLQIGQEVGIVGMLIFIAINVVVAIKLWAQRHDELSALLLATLVGLAFANLLYHAWSDDALAYIWWGLAGIALAPAILTDELKRHGKKQNI